MMEPRLVYNYAIIDESGYCCDVRTTSRNCDGMKGYIPISEFNPDYLEKYYNINDGKWYLESAFVNEWTP